MARRTLTDRVIIITGASSGIGAATAVACAEAGMDVVLAARREDRLHEVAKQVTARGRSAEVVVMDVCQPGHGAAVLDRAMERFGHVDAVFANAGYALEMASIDQTPDDLRRMFDVNFFGAFDLLQLAASRWRASNQGGHLLMCSSCLARFTMPYFGAYCASKAAQLHACRAMRLELRPYRIDVSCVLPVTTITEFHQVSASRLALAGPAPQVPDHAPRLFVQKPQRVAKAVVRCLRLPRAEVWTSHVVRFSAALFTLFPSLQDLVMQREAERRRTIVERRRPGDAEP